MKPSYIVLPDCCHPAAAYNMDHSVCRWCAEVERYRTMLEAFERKGHENIRRAAKDLCKKRLLGAGPPCEQCLYICSVRALTPPARCKGLTKSLSVQCALKAIEGDFCRYHQPQNLQA